MDEIRKIPPVTRFLCGSSLAVTLPVMLQIASPYKLIFVKGLVTQRLEVSIQPIFLVLSVTSIPRYGEYIPASFLEVRLYVSDLCAFLDNITRLWFELLVRFHHAIV